MTLKATIRTDTKAIDPRLVEEVKAINAAFDNAEARAADSKAIQHKRADVQVATFEC